MKRLIAAILMLLVCLVPCPALGESGRPAALHFSSFAGGGYEYTVSIADPDIASCRMQYEYEEQDEPIDGGTYDLTVTFTGLKPGSTKAAVYGRSPIMENDDSDYIVLVDADLNVTLTPARMISGFFVSRMIEGGYSSYRVILEDGGYRVSIDDGPERSIRGDAVDELMRAITAHDVAAWDGFNESDYNVLDGENFQLEIGFTDGTSVYARGDNAFPENYDEAMSEIWRILTWNTEEPDMKLIIGGTEVPVAWEDNASVEALKELLPLTVRMSMYGGFEQVGPIGAFLPRDDESITTEAGDIVLYSGNRIVLFYGSNSWEYTRLGHVELSADDMAGLLGKGDVEIRIEG